MPANLQPREMFPGQEIAVDTAPVALLSGDFNGDGRVDLVSVNRDANNVSVLLGRGGGAFAAPVTYAVGDGPVAAAAAGRGDEAVEQVGTALRSSDQLSQRFTTSEVSVFLP